MIEERSSTINKTAMLRAISRPLRQFSTSNGMVSGEVAKRIMAMSANRATRYVYLRTLPLASEAALSSNKAAVAKEIEAEAERIVGSHAGMASADERASVHVHTAALAIATHRVLSPLLRSESRTEELIRTAFGASPANETDDSSARRLPAYWITRAALWFSPNRLAAVRRMAVNTSRDFGGSFDTEITDGSDKNSNRLVIRTCSTLLYLSLVLLMLTRSRRR